MKSKEKQNKFFHEINVKNIKYIDLKKMEYKNKINCAFTAINKSLCIEDFKNFFKCTNSEIYLMCWI